MEKGVLTLNDVATVRAQRERESTPLPSTALVIFDTTDSKRRPTSISRYVDHGIRLWTIRFRSIDRETDGWDRRNGGSRAGVVFGAQQQQAISSFAGRIVYAFVYYTYTLLYTWKAARYASVMYWLGSWGLQVAFWRLRHHGMWISSRFLIKIPHELASSNRYSRVPLSPLCVSLSLCCCPPFSRTGGIGRGTTLLLMMIVEQGVICYPRFARDRMADAEGCWFSLCVAYFCHVWYFYKSCSTCIISLLLFFFSFVGWWIYRD